MVRLHKIALLLAVLAGTAGAQGTGIDIAVLPFAPVAFDSIVGRITQNQTCILDPENVKISQMPDAVGVVRIDIDYIPGCLPTNGPVVTDVGLGRFPSGTYAVQVYLRNTEVANATFQVMQNDSTVAGHHPLVDYSDLWWNVHESGWGLSIAQHSSEQVFAVWYVYDESNRATWYTLQPGQWTDYRTYAGPVFKTTGPFFGGPFDPSQVAITQVGSATLTFSDSASGVFTYTIDGIVGSKSITRMSSF